VEELSIESTYFGRGIIPTIPACPLPIGADVTGASIREGRRGDEKGSLISGFLSLRTGDWAIKMLSPLSDG